MTDTSPRPKLLISSEFDLPENAALLRPTHIVSVVFDPPPEAEILAMGWNGFWHHVAIDDIAGPKSDEVMRPAARQLCEIGRKLGASDRVLLHCHAGRSRSPAAAMLLDLVWEQEQRQYLPSTAITESIARLAGHERVFPNLALCRAGDETIGLAGRFTTAIEELRAARLTPKT